LALNKKEMQSKVAGLRRALATLNHTRMNKHTLCTQISFTPHAINP
jgi:hypothetical protein